MTKRNHQANEGAKPLSQPSSKTRGTNRRGMQQKSKDALIALAIYLRMHASGWKEDGPYEPPTERQIAGDLGCSQSTAHKRLHRLFEGGIKGYARSGFS